MLLVVLACCIGQPGPPTKAIYAHVTSKRVRADALINEGKYEEARYVRLAGRGGWESGRVRRVGAWGGRGGTLGGFGASHKTGTKAASMVFATIAHT